MKPRQMPASEFKTHCLAVMDEVQRTGQEIIVTKRGRPVCKVMPVATRRFPNLIGSILWEAPDAYEPLDEPWFTTLMPGDDCP